MTQGLASTFNVRAGDTWHGAGQSWRVVGIVQNPQSLLDEFALVAPGQVTSPNQVTVLFDPHGADVLALGHNYQTPQSAASGNVFNPETIVFAVATVGMLLIALVSVGGFTVLAQRRLRSIGMLGALGATDRNIKLVVKANGAVVGVVGRFVGAALGLVAWLLYRPHAEASSHHLIGAFTLPWAVIIPSMIVAIVATYLAASRPARSITKVPIVTALSGRPSPPRQIHRSAIPGVLVLVLAILLLSYAGSMRGGGGAPEVIFGLVSLIVALILLSPLSLTALAKVTRRTPIAVRLAIRDLARYRARSGSALSAISLGVLIAVLVCVLAAARTGMSSTTRGPIWPRTSWWSTRPTLALDKAFRAADPRAPRRRVCRPWRRARTTWERLWAHKTWLRSSQRTPTSSTRRTVVSSAARSTWPPRRSSRPSGSPLLRSTPRPTSSPCGRGSPPSP